MSNDNIIEAEASPQQSLIVRTEQPVVQPGLFGTTEPATIISKASDVASALKAVVKKQGLISNISGKEYPRCEAWTLLGTMLGVFPVCSWTKQVEGGWEARVEARTKDGCIIGAAEAQCLRAEKNWANRDDFAIRSMAQTRATAKCLRMPLGFVMTLAGYEATPAEEMVAEQVAPAPPAHKPTPKPAPKLPTAATRQWMIEQLNAGPGKPNEKIVREYFEKLGDLMPNEITEELPLRFVPWDKKELELLINCLSNFEAGGDAVAAFEPHTEADVLKQNAPQGDDGTSGQDRKSYAPSDVEDNEDDSEWRRFPMPFGRYAGTLLHDLSKNYLFGLWANYKVETEYNGKPKTPETIAKDTKFRELLDQAGDHYEFKKKD